MNNTGIIKDKNKKSDKEEGKGSQVLLFVSGGIVVTLVACYFLIPAFKEGINNAFEVLTSKDKPRIKQWVERFGAMGPIVLALSVALQMFLLFVPNILLFIIAIVCYGPFWGGLISMSGVFISSTMGYFIGKKLGPRALNRFVSEKVQEKIRFYVKRYGVVAIAVTRLSSLSNDALSFVAGILEMSYKKYILATLSGILPLIVILAIYGHNGNINRALIWIGAISLILLFIYIVIDRRIGKRKGIVDREPRKNGNGKERPCKEGEKIKRTGTRPVRNGKRKPRSFGKDGKEEDC